MASTSVRISTRFDFERDGVVVSIDPEQTADLAPFIMLHKAIVDEGYAV